MTLFTSVVDGDWNDPTTWDVGVGYPVITDDAVLNSIVRVKGNQAIHALTINDDGLIFDGQSDTVPATLEIADWITIYASFGRIRGDGIGQTGYARIFTNDASVSYGILNKGIEMLDGQLWKLKNVDVLELDMQASAILQIEAGTGSSAYVAFTTFHFIMGTILIDSNARLIAGSPNGLALTNSLTLVLGNLVPGTNSSFEIWSGLASHPDIYATLKDELVLETFKLNSSLSSANAITLDSHVICEETKTGNPTFTGTSTKKVFCRNFTQVGSGTHNVPHLEVTKVVKDLETKSGKRMVS
jgi:hypothetical protein